MKTVRIVACSGFCMLESSRSNLFFVKEGVFHTPQSNILEGITRKYVMDLIQQKYTLKLGDFSLEEFKQADEVFTTGSTKRIVPITQIDNQVINSGKRGPYTEELFGRFDVRCMMYEECRIENVELRMRIFELNIP